MSNDYISRQSAINAADRADYPGLAVEHVKAVTDEVIKELIKLPSAERHGKWLDGYGFAGNYYDCFVCDQCKKESMAKTNYCPHCGALMDEVT